MLISTDRRSPYSPVMTISISVSDRESSITMAQTKTETVSMSETKTVSETGMAVAVAVGQDQRLRDDDRLSNNQRLLHDVVVGVVRHSVRCPVNPTGDSGEEARESEAL